MGTIVIEIGIGITIGIGVGSVETALYIISEHSFIGIGIGVGQWKNSISRCEFYMSEVMVPQRETRKGITVYKNDPNVFFFFLSLIHASMDACICVKL